LRKVVEMDKKLENFYDSNNGFKQYVDDILAEVRSAYNMDRIAEAVAFYEMRAIKAEGKAEFFLAIMPFSFRQLKNDPTGWPEFIELGANAGFDEPTIRGPSKINAIKLNFQSLGVKSWT
jgi:hypothetical protein